MVARGAAKKEGGRRAAPPILVGILAVMAELSAHASCTTLPWLGFFRSTYFCMVVIIVIVLGNPDDGYVPVGGAAGTVPDLNSRGSLVGINAEHFHPPAALNLDTLGQDATGYRIAQGNGGIDLGNTRH